MGAKHPPPLDDMSKISRKQYFTAGLAVVIMALTFHPLPIEIVTIGEGGVKITEAPEQLNLSSEIPEVFQVTIENTGNMEKDVQLLINIDGEPVLYDPLLPQPDWNTSTFGPIEKVAESLWAHGGWFVLLMDDSEMEVRGGEGKELAWNLVMGCSRNMTSDSRSVMEIGFSTRNEISWTSVLLRCNNPSTP
jgi:hypothetical protein